MWSNAKLYFDNIEVDWEEDEAPSVCRVLFRPSDFLQVPFRKLPAHLRAFEKEAREYYDVIQESYSVLCSSAAAAERRLSILGYSRGRAEEAWNSAKTEALLKAEQDNSSETLREMNLAIADLFDTISYKEWQTKYTEILRAKASGANDNSDETFIFLRSLNPTEVRDPLMWVAIQLYALEPTKLWVDLTEVIESEDETKESIFGEDEIPDRFKYAFGKITLLTEGVTDSRILSASLNEFYPEARDLYSFVDFEGFKVEGGASPLAKLLRGFAGAGLTDRYIAIFDNDAAGHEAFALVKSVALPPNIRAITLPDLVG